MALAERNSVPISYEANVHGRLGISQPNSSTLPSPHFDNTLNCLVFCNLDEIPQKTHVVHRRETTLTLRDANRATAGFFPNQLLPGCWL